MYKQGQKQNVIQIEQLNNLVFWFSKYQWEFVFFKLID